MERTITIVGGGVAGLTLGILLRKEGIPVELWEAGAYPRHRVCGEYVSGRGVELLDRLGVLSDLPRRESRTVRFFLNGQGTKLMQLPRAAISIARYDLDQRLADELTKLGGSIRQCARWTEDFSREGVVRATGRRLERSNGHDPLVGIKVHARNLATTAGLELHFSKAGYAGFC